jgi:hypothetical protein
MTKTVAGRIYYAINRVQILRALLEAIEDGGGSVKLDRPAVSGLMDVLDDITVALEPLTEISGALPHEINTMSVSDAERAQ